MPNGHDKNWVRLCLALDGFHILYNHWPSRVVVHPVILSNIRNRLLSADDFAKVSAKVSLVPGEGPMIAFDDVGHRYSYGNDTGPQSCSAARAAEWLGVRPKHDDGTA